MGRLSVSRYHNDFCIGVNLFNCPDGPNAIQLRHDHIKENNIRARPGKFSDSLLSIACLTRNLITPFCKYFFQNISCIFGIINNKDPRHMDEYSAFTGYKSSLCRLSEGRNC